MHLPFYKYHGTGNDFIIVDNRQGMLGKYTHRLITDLCDRHFGIGADGFIVINNHLQYDFEMIYYNADGSKSLCGNGSRCAVHLANQLGIIDQEAYFLTTDGLHKAYIKENLVHLHMHDVFDIHTIQNGYWLNVGAPHYVEFILHDNNLDVCKTGQAIRNSLKLLEVDANVNFVQLKPNNILSVRTYERGVEDETLSCGTGVVAASLVAATKGYTSPVDITTQGGTLHVRFTKKSTQHFQDIYLVGPVKQVFQGEVAI